MTRLSRRAWLKKIAGTGAVSSVAGSVTRAAIAEHAVQAPTTVNGAIVPRTSAAGVFTPPRGRGFQKFSFDFPEPSVAFEGFEFSFRVFTHENTYALAAPHLTARAIDNGVEIACSELVWAGGQQRAAGRVIATITRHGSIDAVECRIAAAMERP